MWCSYQLLELSFWRHPFTAEDPLLSKWCNATFLQIYSNEEKKNLQLGCPESEYIFIVALTIGKFLERLHYLQQKH